MLALQCCSRQLYIVAVISYVLYRFHCGPWLFDGISVFDSISMGRNSYICCSQVLWNLLGRFHTAKGGVDILLVD